MNPAAMARSSINELLNEGAIEQVSVDADTVQRLVAQAAKHIPTAQAGIALEDNEGAFQLAYDACRKTCNALVLATGFRVTTETTQHHARTFEAAAAIAANFGERRIVEDGAELRYVRNGAEYRGEDVSAEEAEEAVDIAIDLVSALDGPIAKILSSHGH